MPVTEWDDIRGHRCDLCGNWATHWWADRPICCDCHAGKGLGLVSAAEAARHNGEVPHERH
jgi:hypothetical protein